MASLATARNLFVGDEKGDANFNVDFVIDYNFASADRVEAQAQFVKLIEALNDVGLATEVRSGDNFAVLVFVKAASGDNLNAEVYKARVQDWLLKVRTTVPHKDVSKALEAEPITEAEHLRLVYLLITKPKEEGGAGITPKSGEWKHVQSIFALHDNAYNRQWIVKLSSKYLLTSADLEEIKNRFGEKIGFYFAFLQSYFMFLTFPAAFGTFCWLFLGHYSPLYAIVNGLWCIIYTEYWRKQQTDLAVQWGVRGVSEIKNNRPEFSHDSIAKDPITGEDIKVYAPFKRLARQALVIPFALTAAILLGSLIVTTFSVEIFISEVYAGPLKAYLVFLPSLMLSLGTPTITTILTAVAGKLTDLENYETKDSHDAALIHKVFILNFVTAYLPIFLTAFVYVPFAEVLVPYLDVLQITVKPFAENERQMTAPKAGFQINKNRLKNQVISFTVTAQLVNFITEIVVPYVKRYIFKQVKAVRAGRAVRQGASAVGVDDLPEEKDFLTRVRDEAELPGYDVTVDFREMVIQFGYLSLFSVIWPLAGLSFLFNNWFELRGDALKIALETQRPVPWRAEHIGPWLDHLGALAWMGSLSSAALIYLFSGDGLGPNGTPWNIKAWGLLITMFFSEHIFLAVRLAVRKALSKIDSPGLQKERAEVYERRQKYMIDSLPQEATTGAKGQAGEISLAAYNEKTGEAINPANNVTPKDKFWKSGRDASIAVGRSFIANQISPPESKKEL